MDLGAVTNKVIFRGVVRVGHFKKALFSRWLGIEHTAAEPFSPSTSQIPRVKKMPGEKFSVRLVPEEGGPSERVVVEVGMDGFNVLSNDGSRTLRKYPLPHISRWSSRGTSLILFTRSPVRLQCMHTHTYNTQELTMAIPQYTQVDVEDRSVTLQGDEHTIRSVLDTLTSCCMQMAELIQSGHGGGDRAAGNALNTLLKKSKQPAAELPTADQVEFWKSPEKAGWMYSQGEHIKTWRKRWFILKQGFLFRFSSAEVNAASKPRGVVDLSQVTDVSDGSAMTGRPNSIKLSTATGSRCYITDSETSQVEWISGLEASVAKIVRIVAGVDGDEEESTPSTVASRALAEQFKSYGGSGSGSGGGSRRRESGSSHRRHHHHQQQHQQQQHHSYDDANRTNTANGMVSVLNYGNGNGSGPTTDRQQQQQHYVTVDYGSGGGGASPMGGFQIAPSEQNLGGGGGGMYGAVYAPPPNLPSVPQQQHQINAYGRGEVYGGAGVGQPPPNSYTNNNTQIPYQQQQQQQPQQHQQQAGPAMNATLMDAVTTPAPQAQQQQQQQGSPWQVHYTSEGRPYYYNVQTQITQWEAPASA